MKKIIASLLLFGALAMPACAKTDTATIKRADGQEIVFNVERATNFADREYGLMFRTSMPRDHGMLFIYEQPSEIAFWMKNTLIPLDMLFFNTAGELVYIQPMAVPKSLEPINSGRNDICAVLELNGGEAAAQGLKPGDRLVLSTPTACLP